MKLHKTVIIENAAIVCCVLSLSLILVTSSSSVKAEDTILALAPSSYTAQNIGQNLTLNITIANVENLWSWKTRITWEQDVLSLVKRPVEGPFMRSAGSTLFLSSPAKNGTITEISDTFTSAVEVSGNGTLATLVFRVDKETFMSPITLDNEVLQAPRLSNGTHPQIAHQMSGATVTLGSDKGIRADAGPDQSVIQGTSTILNGSGTHSNDTNLNFIWRFTDGKSIELYGKVVSYAFLMSGVHLVNLTVSDSEGRMSNDSTMITVVDVTPPIAVISVEGVSSYQHVEAGQSVFFNGTDSYDPLNGTITSYIWYDGEGMTFVDSCFTHTYTIQGTYNVTLTVADDGGNKNTAYVVITVVNPANPLSLFSLVGLVLVAVTTLTIVGLPFWIGRAWHERQSWRAKKVKSIDRFSIASSLIGLCEK